MTDKILIIEDEEVLLDILKKKLEDEGYSVVVATDGAEGLAQIESTKPDLILLDIVMPKLTGYDILEEMKHKGIKIPVIIISNSGQPVDIEKAMSLGARDYFVKAELNPDEILKKIKKCLGEEINEGSDETGASQKPKGKIILLAEDDSFLRELCSKKLIKKGYVVDEAIDGLVAYEKIVTEKPDLVLLDVIMPGMEGFEILKKVRNHKDKKINQVPVIVLSNLGQEDDVRKGIELGANDYLIKANHTMDEIIDKVKKYLKQ